MGLILGALAGAGQQAADFADKQITQDQALERETHSSNLALDRAKALEIAKVELASKERGAMVERVQGAASQIADEKLAPKIAQEKAGITDPSSWTPEQQAAVDQSNEIDRKGLIDRAMSDGSAGMRTGDITPKDAMGNASKLEINQIKMDSLLARAEDKNATTKEIADVRAAAMRYGYDLRLQAAQERAASGKVDRATGRMLITSEDANIKASTNQQMMLSREKENLPKMVAGKPNPRLAEIDTQIADLNDEIKTSKANKDAYLKELGILGAAGARAHPEKTDPKPGAAPAAAPAASGKAPYPDGTKLVDKQGKKFVVKNGVPVPAE